MWKLPNGLAVSTPRAITVGDIQHPANIFYAWSREELNEIGIKKINYNSFDSRYYRANTFTDEEDGIKIKRTYHVEPKYTVEKMKRIKLDLVKKDYFANLSYLNNNADFYSAVGENESASLFTDGLKELRTAMKEIKHDLKRDMSYDEVVAWNPTLPTLPEVDGVTLP